MASNDTTDPKTEPETFGIQGLVDEIEAETGKAYQPATIRVLLRKLAAENKIEKSSGRWTFAADDPAVDIIIDAVKNGRAEKEETPEKAAPKKAPAKKAPAKKTAPKDEPVEEEDLDVDLDEL